MTLLITDKLKELGFRLPQAPKAAGLYLPVTQVGNLLYTSGTLPFGANGELEYTMQIGDANIPEGQAAALCCVLNVLAVVNNALPNGLEQIERVVKLSGFVNSHTGFCRQPEVVNAASKALIDIWGEKGKHVRTAIGVSELPLGASVELEFIFELKA
jgi:enamine deaminase RidA (YjgF/YER057c/UK114 family)